MLPSHPDIPSTQIRPLMGPGIIPPLRYGDLGPQRGPPPTYEEAALGVLAILLYSIQSTDAVSTAPQVPVIDMSIPVNTGVVGAIISRVTICLPVDISFEDFFSRVCARMDLNLVEANLGYKFHCDKAHDPPQQLSNDEQLCGAMVQGVDLMKRARSHRVFMEIHNLVGVLSVSLFF